MGLQDRLSLNAGQKYCRMLQGEHSAILSTYIELPNGFKTFLYIFEWPLKTGFTVYAKNFSNVDFGCMFKWTTIHTFSCKLSNPRIFFLAESDLGDDRGLSGDFFTLGETVLLRKLPWIL